MKHYLTTLLFLFVLVSCSKDDAPGSKQIKIISLTPDNGGAGTEVTITGKNFSATAGENEVLINGKKATIQSATPTELKILIPALAGTGSIKVTSPAGTAEGLKFTYSYDVYVAGAQMDDAQQYRATYWKNGEPTTLTPDNTGTAYTMYIDVYRQRRCLRRRSQWPPGCGLEERCAHIAG